MGAHQSSICDDSLTKNKVSFLINGVQHNVDTDQFPINPEYKLVDYIRDKAGLTGTKYMCREGGCGACVVTVRTGPIGKNITRSVNSCLVPILSADGWEITTVEGLGDKKKGYHKTQEQIVQFNGTQCGYCTPGVLMNFYSLSQNNPSFKAQDVEDAFDGNICRCTGYRPILDAFKAMSESPSEELRRKHAELQTMAGCLCSSFKSGCCQQLTQRDEEGENDFETVTPIKSLFVTFKSGETWIRATNLENTFKAIQQFSSMGLSYTIVAGNTGKGVYKTEAPYLGFIDVNNVSELKQSTISASGVEIGIGATLSEAIELFQKASVLDGYSYMGQISKHLKRVANTPIRNVGTIGGNLLLKHNHREFTSDVFLLFEAVGAKLKIASSAISSQEYSILEFWNMNMNDKVIVSAKFPAYKGGLFFFKSFKITKRYQNAHAYVNAAMMMKVDPKRNYSVRDKPTIVFGGINPEFVHAVGTEIFFVGKFLNQKTIRGAMMSLEKEIQPNSMPIDANAAYRKRLTQSLLYKFILGIMNENVQPRLKSGSMELERYLTQGKQDFDSDESQWPLYQPVSKIEGRVQASGEAQYINDIEHRPGELFGAFVYSKIANGKLLNVDPSEALVIQGVQKFITAKDIPGYNNAAIFYPESEEVFVTEKVKHAGQAIGLILADSRELALCAAKKVIVTYSDVQKPVLSLKDSLSKAKEEGAFEQCILQVTKSSIGPVAGDNNIQGEFEIGAQYHFHMETQTCLCVPKEDGMNVFSSTQFPNGVQAMVATTLGVPLNSVSVSVRRLGGAYGAKISKATHIAAACAVAANAMNKPVRIVLDLESNMKMVGKRLPYLARYEVGVDGSGKILNLKCEIFCDPGCNANEATSLFALLNLQRANGWKVIAGKGITDTHPNTYCRAPGSTQGIAIIENIMEHIAHTLKLDPLQIRMNNFIQEGDDILGIPGITFQGDNPLPKLIQDLKTSSEYDERWKFVKTFNQNNRWKKRGLSIVPMRYPNHYLDQILRFPVYISVYAVDGTVNISHAGIEMGQGINTKCVQVVAHTLGIPIGKIKVQPTTTLISPNSGVTGGAVTSELICHAAVECCKQLQEKMKPIKEKLENPTWEEIAMACYKEHILLTAHHQDKLNTVQPYDIWGITLTEVEVDTLTGEHKIVRVDLYEDAGKSISPNVDIGQIEGAFVMGLGLWTSEKLIYDQNTGELLTCNSWDYKPPLPRDIPEDFRITMVKNRTNPYGVLGSKATGESPITMSCSVMFAIKQALNSARSDAGNSEWFQMNAPVTVEDIQGYALTSKEQFDI